MKFYSPLKKMERGAYVSFQGCVDMVELTLEKAILIAISLTIALVIGLQLIVPLIEWIQSLAY